ncbi:CopD family protein [Dyadobacter arcticus]|uniref:Protoporphyrinogen IX oxidase n=1 Tax=Dyadobacter arcticus TaxID=1078754 RepID=A0ABX0UHN1_9BACT|nr:CopD family protein [Dyadobacter arcticus]NIJ50885.1 putative membrane protein [Dyadobacter arcticus]
MQYLRNSRAKRSTMTYLHFKALHIIFVVSWFAGLFYMPRLFVYHTEANDKSALEKEILFAQFTKMEKLLWNAIMTPACWLALLCGTAMLYINPALLDQDWMKLKLLFVLGLLGYHSFTRKILLELRAGKFRYTSFQLRLFNEIATIFLFSIVFLVVLKNTVDWLWGVLGLTTFAILIMTAVRIVRSMRKKNKKD